MNRFAFAKCIVTLLWAVAAFCVNAANPYEEYERLYPGCVDNQPSKIYEPNEWPKGLETPQFPNGGDITFISYIYRQLENDYPDVVDSVVPSQNPNEPDIVYRAKGTVMVHITVDRCGRAVNPVIETSMNEKYDKAALNICQSLPVFKPGSLGGVRVKVGMLIPVRFTRSGLPNRYDFGDSWSDSGDYSSGDSGSGSSDDTWGSGDDQWNSDKWNSDNW